MYMSNRIIRLVATIAVIVVVFSAFNIYLLLDNIRVQNQLSAQEEKIDELHGSLAHLSIQTKQLAELQDVVNTQEERFNELQTNLDALSVSEEQLNLQQEQQLQQTQITELQNVLTVTRAEIEEILSTLSIFATQMSTFRQDISTSLDELGTARETVENLISELTDLENRLNQLLDQTPQQVYKAAHTSVVVIRTPVGLGSGFVFADSNIIVTNYHVVTEETDIEIEFFDRTRVQATVIGADAYSDVAVLTVPSAPIEAMPLIFSDQTDVSIGQQVVAIGTPLGLSESLSVGYISQVNRTLDLEPIIVPVLQLDLTIAPGSSGGPLLDLSGNVVGITNAGTDVGFNFAVPLNILRRVIPALITNGEYIHPFIGVYAIGLTPEVISDLNILNVNLYQKGLLVMGVVEGFPAAEAGLTPAVSGAQGYTAMDIILAVDGYPTFIVEDLTAYMEVEVSPGQVITLTLWRQGVISSVTFTTAERSPYQG